MYGFIFFSFGLFSLLLFSHGAFTSDLIHDWLHRFIYPYLSLLNFKLTLSSIYIYIPVRLHASSVHSDTHSSFICSLSWFLHLIFSICLFHAFLWSGLAIQTHHTAAPVNFLVFVPAYVHYEMLLYILMEYCTLVSITAWGESLKCPHSPVPNNRHVYLKFQLNVCFSFFAVWSLAHTHSFSFTKSSKIYIKTIWKSSLCNSVAQKNPYAMPNATNKTFFFLFLLGFNAFRF